MGTLTGRRILVTGAGSGIGRAAARLFTERGAELVLIGRRLEPLRAALPDARHVALDHADEAAVIRFAGECPEISGMFLNAGGFVPRFFATSRCR